mgnify:CR=1 FL=1
MSDSLHIVCPHCQGVNRVPAPKLGEGAKCGRCHRPLFGARPLEVDEAGFARHVQRDEIPLLVDFWAPWCGPCKMIGPIIEELASEFDGKAKVGKVNVDDNQQLAAQFGIRGIPTVMVFKGGELVAQHIGAQHVADAGLAKLIETFPQ